MAFNKSTGMWEGFIYMIENDINNLKYIGQTRETIDRRFKRHIKSSKTLDYSLYRAMRKYGVYHFTVKQIESISCHSRDELNIKLNELEMYYIQLYNTYKNGYNMSIGGDYSPNTFAEIPVIQYDLKCNYVAEYNSMSEAARQTGVMSSSISQCCNKTGKLYSVGGFIWRFKDNPLDNEEEKQYLMNKLEKRVDQYDSYGNLLNTFNNAIEAIEYLGYSKSNAGHILGSCKGKGCVGGFIWRKHGEDFNKYPIPTSYIQRRVEQRDIKDGHLIAIFNNCKEASDITGINRAGINECCNGKYKESGGYLWCFEGNNNWKNYSPIGKKVDMYSLDGSFIKTYSSIKQAADDIGVDYTTISAVCHNKGKTAKGYKWKFHEELIDKT